MPNEYTIFETAWGYAGLATSRRGLCRSVLPCTRPTAVETVFSRSFPKATYRKNLLTALKRQITAYFDGEPSTFPADLVLDISKETPFARIVLQVCRRIPRGQIRTYAELAQAAGSPQAARAVGGVMARNPLPLLIPCHRVVGANGRLTGFSAEGGIHLKRRMLLLEGVAKV